MIHKAEEDLEQVFVSAGFEKNDRNVQQIVKSEIQSQLEHCIEFNNEGTIGVDTWYRKETEDNIAKGIEKLIRKNKGRLISVDRNALRNFRDKMEKLAKIMAKAHNNEHIFTYEQMDD